MKKHIRILLVLCMIVLILVAASKVNFIRMSNSSDDVIDISVSKLDKNASEISLYVNYSDYGTMFEIAKDITVSSDPNFENILKRNGCIVEDGLYKYTFTSDSDIDVLCIKAPVLYIPTQIESVDLKVESEGSVKKDGQIWFTISDIIMGEDTLRISIRPENKDIPRFPTLIDKQGNIYRGDTEMDFDSDGNLISGMFIFENIPLDSFNLQDSQLSISNALIRTTVNENAFSQNTLAITIVK